MLLLFLLTSSVPLFCFFDGKIFVNLKNFKFLVLLLFPCKTRYILEILLIYLLKNSEQDYILYTPMEKLFCSFMGMCVSTWVFLYLFNECFPYLFFCYSVLFDLVLLFKRQIRGVCSNFFAVMTMV